MAVERTKLFDSIANGAAWDAGVVFNRTNAIPIDKFSVFDSYENAVIYATTNPVAYPGQLIAVVPEDDRARSYIILSDNTLKEIGVDIDLAPLEARLAELESVLQNSIKEISNKGSEITYTRANGQTGSFNTTWVGTRAEYTEAYAAGNIPVGTIVVITDEADDEEGNDTPPANDGATSAILGQGVLGYLILG
jgi:hypothetical protein